MWKIAAKICNKTIKFFKLCLSENLFIINTFNNNQLSNTGLLLHLYFFRIYLALQPKKNAENSGYFRIFKQKLILNLKKYRTICQKVSKIKTNFNLLKSLFQAILAIQGCFLEENADAKWTFLSLCRQNGNLRWQKNANAKQAFLNFHQQNGNLCG